KRMETHVGDRYLNLARTKALSLEMTIDERLEQAEGLSLTPFIITSVEKSNASYLNKSDDDIQKEIHQLDREWIASSGKTAAADRIKNSPLSVFLRALQDKAPERYGEIFITDQRGAVIAMTAPLTDYNQADELWWRHSFDQGRGRPFIDNRGYDKSVGAVVFGIALPIEKNGAVIGILKVNYRMSEVLSALAPEKLDVSGSIFLADSLGHFILSKGGVERAALNEKEQAIVKSSGTGWTEDLHNGTATIMAYDPVKTEIFTRIAKSSATMDIAGEQWVPSHWTVFFEIDRALAFSLIRNITNLFWVVGLFVLVSSVLLAKLLARRISAPLEMLIKGVKDVGAGQHAEAVQVTSRDEISQLANAFNDMTRRLREVTVSRDALNQEIQARQKLENALRDSNARLNAIFEDASDAIILADIRTGRFATFNKRAHQVFGYDAEEFSRLRLSDLGLEDIHYTPESTTEEAPAKAAFILPQKCRVKAGVLRDFLITSRLISINGNRYSLKIMQDV
ncbi:MAG: cache domain-containing protein, partial [Nitrospiria bacterium]